jgi:alpha-glucosidase
MGHHRPWWQHGVIYQVYPRSFQDAGGDGVGDLPGIRERAGYLDWLGVDAVWLSPIFRSPMADFGYDVADYDEVDPLFGTVADVEGLVDDLHRRGMRLLLDLVPNHTSDRHPWFVAARASRAAARRDWYIWRDPRPDGSPPNDWIAAFGGSAWQWDEQTGQYYFHSFLKEQPDLNWRNPEVREAIYDVMRSWFRRGVDGFRIDVVNLLAKRFELEALPPDRVIDPTLADDPLRAAPVLRRQRWAASPDIHAIHAEMRAVADEYPQRVLIGEIWLPLKRLVRFYGRDLRGLHMPFNFQLITVPWTAASVHDAVVRYERLLPEGGWPNWVLGNHDRSRIASRVGPAQARVAALLLLTLRGTPTIYYGDEIGMVDVAIPKAAQRDPQGLRGGESRDPVRTPMRWDAMPGAGFSVAAPWLPIGPDLERTNVAAQRDDPSSMLTLHRRLLELRRAEAALSVGAWQDLGRTDAAIAFLRSAGSDRFLVVANLSGSATAMPAAAAGYRGRVVVSTLSESGAAFDRARELEPDEAFVVRLA